MTRSHRPWPPLALLAGGFAWTGWSLIATATGSIEGSVLTLALVASSGLFLAVGLVGLVLTLAWPYQFPGGEGAAIAALGGVLFAIGQVVTIVSDGGGLVTWFVAPGVLAFVGGSVLLAVGLVRARRIPPWLGVGLFVGSVLFLGFNAVPALSLPFGLAWLALGRHLWRYPDRPTDHLEPSALGR